MRLQKYCLVMRRMTFMNFVCNMVMNYFVIHELRGSSHKQCIMWKVVSFKNINKKPNNVVNFSFLTCFIHPLITPFKNHDIMVMTQCCFLGELIQRPCLIHVYWHVGELIQPAW